MLQNLLNDVTVDVLCGYRQQKLDIQEQLSNLLCQFDNLRVKTVDESQVRHIN